MRVRPYWCASIKPAQNFTPSRWLTKVRFSSRYS